MDTQIHLKKFFKDIYNDSSMYYDYMAGRLSLDQTAFLKWYAAMERRNREFLKMIRDDDHIRFSDSIIETALSQHLTVTTTTFRKRTIEVSEMATPKIELLEVGSDSHHYICNGCYETTLQNIYRVLSKGSFTVGICCEKKTDEYRDLVKYYNMLKDFLMRKGYRAASFESNISSKDKMYLLMYDSKRQGKRISR